jgi:hypothetical protein
MHRAASRVPLLSVLALACSAVSDLAAQFVASVESSTRHTSRVAWRGRSGEQAVAIEHGQPKWRATHAAFVERATPGTVPLGPGEPAALRTDVAIAFGDRKLPVGRYQVGVEREAGGGWAMIFSVEPSELKRDLNRAFRSLTVPMQFTTGAPLVELLDFTLQEIAPIPRGLRLTVAWGTYRLHTDLVPDFDVRLPEGAPEFALTAANQGTTTASGLRYEQLRAGEGAKPEPGDLVRVHYSAWLTNGRMFDSSWVAGEPLTFPLDAVVPGFAEGLRLMQPGGVARFTIPPQLAYGDRGVGNRVPPGATLVFHVTLLGPGK